MFAVIFEVRPGKGQFDAYLDLASLLRPEVERIDGFLENWRFRSRSRPDWMVSLSYWRDEKALIRWRTHGGHHLVQAKGRSGIFADYHLRVGEVFAGDGAAAMQSRLDETEIGDARAITLVDMPGQDAAPDAPGLVGWDLFDGITVPGSRLMLLAWRDRAACAGWDGTAGDGAAEDGAAGDGAGGERRRDVRIIRDYSMADRREAPQYFA